MNAKDAVKIAIPYIADLFEAEKPTNIGLEEVVYDDTADAWDVTVGFSRPWDYPDRLAFGLPIQQLPKRQYKVVRVNQTGNVLFVKNREMK